MYVKTHSRHTESAARSHGQNHETLPSICFPEQIQGGRQEERLQLSVLSAARDHGDAVRSDSDWPAERREETLAEPGLTRVKG